MSEFTYRDLTTLEEFAQVVELERQIWGPGYDEVVPVPILAVSVHRGGVLIGAFDGDRMIGFVYSLPGIKHGKATQWSHMAGVVAEHRSAGLGQTLKLLQRDRTLAMGLDLIEWTYDPLQVLNANLNIVTLGVVVEEYEENVYGESASPLHGGLPTDRFVCQWWIRRPHVERRVGRVGQVGRVGIVSHEVATAPVVNEAAFDGAWLDCRIADLTRNEPRLAVDIPIDFTGMLAADLPRARRWRFHTREIFTHYFQAGYRVVDFSLHREHHRGRYLLTTIRPID
jgi:predicted GNAT superfamily acetyltransferase